MASEFTRSPCRKKKDKSLFDKYAVLVFGVALLVRSGVVLVYENTVFTERAFNILAVNLATGKGLSFPAEKEKHYIADPMPDYLRLWAKEGTIYGVVKTDSPTSFWPPGYPVFLSLFYRLFGQSRLGARLIGGLLGSLACTLVYLLARFLTDRGPALMAGLFASVHPPLVLFSVALQSEGLFVLFVLMSLWTYFHAVESKISGFWCLAVGAVSGAAFLTRPIGIVIVFGCMICWLIQSSGKKRVRGCAAQLAALLIVISPWIVRNYIVHHQLVILPTQGGFNAWMYSASCFDPDSRGRVGWFEKIDWQRYRSIVNFQGGDIKRPELMKFPEFHEETEVERDRILRQRTLAFLRANPRLLLGLIYYRVVSLFEVVPRMGSNQLARIAVAISTTVLLLFGFLGAVVALFSGDRRFLVVYVLTIMYLCAASMTMGGMRAHVPIQGFYCIFGAVFLTWCINKLNPRRI